MNPTKVRRDRLGSLTDLPNVGPAVAVLLRQVGIDRPDALVGADAYELYDRLEAVTGERHDPCVLDTFLSVVRFMAGDEPLPWWAYTADRKQALAARDFADGASDS